MALLRFSNLFKLKRRSKIRYSSRGKFEPDYDMAVAWKRLSQGKPEDRDILLPKHELLGSQVEKE